jgi:hypothetical protein
VYGLPLGAGVVPPVVVEDGAEVVPEEVETGRVVVDDVERVVVDEVVIGRVEVVAAPGRHCE